MSSDSFTLDIATPTKALTSPSSIVTTQPADDDASDSNGLVDFQKSGGYIYIILFVAFTIAMVYFIKVALAKRKVKMQLEKEYDNEVPPGYDGHVFDIQVHDSGYPRNNRSSDTRASRANSNPVAPSLPDTLSPLNPTGAAIHPVQPPERALTRISSVSLDPPAYEELIELPKINRSPSSVNIVSDTTTAAMASSPSPSPRTSRSP